MSVTLRQTDQDLKFDKQSMRVPNNPVTSVAMIQHILASF